MMDRTSLSFCFTLKLIFLFNRTFGSNDKADFCVTAGILRLSTKYLIDSLRTKALDHLSIAWPSSLKGWDAREDLVGEYYVDADGARRYPSPVVSRMPFTSRICHQITSIFYSVGDNTTRARN